MPADYPDLEGLRQLLAEEAGIRQKLLPEIDAELVCRYGGQVGSRIECHRHLPRAMDYARSQIAKAEGEGRSLASGTVILVDRLSGSKGRFSRSWHAPAGGLWGCLIHVNSLLPSSRRFLPFAIGVACCEALRSMGIANSWLRWVNDVLVDGKKVAGFLAESFTSAGYGEEYDLLGFGINVNNTDFPAELAATATAIAAIQGKPVDVTAFTSLFLTKLSWNVGLLYYEEARELSGDGFSGANGRHLLLESWLDLADTIGRRVVFGFDVITAPQYEAEVLDLDDDGGLVLQLADGWCKTEYCGEVRYLATPSPL